MSKATQNITKRNSETQLVFEIADDALQALIGYFHFIDAAVTSVSDEKIRMMLPKESYKMTPDWFRNYNREELLRFMRDSFYPVHSRQCLVIMASHFEAAVSDFQKVLKEVKKVKLESKYTRNYKAKLLWMWDLIRKSKFGTKEMQKRIPTLCLIADDARRIRNLFVHNKGLLNLKYETDFLKIGTHKPIIYRNFDEYKKDTRIKIPILLSAREFMKFCICHIELLHFLHNEIQVKYFKFGGTPYSYRLDKKVQDWKRLFLGI